MLQRILIVDDEERFRTTLGKRLSERGLDVETVGSGEEALKVVKEKLFDVIILDVKMPGIDSMRNLNGIEEDQSQHRSAAVDRPRLGRLGRGRHAPGGLRLLMKPCEIEVLMEKINGAYEIKAGRDDRIRQAEIRRLVDRSPA